MTLALGSLSLPLALWCFPSAPLAPNARRQPRREAGAERRLLGVGFRVKAPVTRRPPHRPGRAQFTPPVPRSPPACASGAPNRRHPVWRITVLTLALKGPAGQFSGVSWIWLVSPASLPEVPPDKRDARRCLPSSGSLGHGSPPSPVLCAAKTTPCPSRVASLVARFPIPHLLHGVRGLPRGRMAWSKPPGHARALGRPVPPSGMYARRQVVLPRSRATPLKPCPALRPRWCPVHAPLSHTGLLPSGAGKPSAFVSIPLRLSC